MVKRVDVSKVQLDVFRPWVQERIEKILGFEDEVVNNFVMSLLEQNEETEKKELNSNLKGFLEAGTADFVDELWELLSEAEDNARELVNDEGKKSIVPGVPRAILEAKKAELMRQHQVNHESDPTPKENGARHVHSTTTNKPGKADKPEAEKEIRSNGEPDNGSAHRSGSAVHSSAESRDGRKKSPRSSRSRSRSRSRSHPRSRSRSPSRSRSRSPSRSRPGSNARNRSSKSPGGSRRRSLSSSRSSSYSRRVSRGREYRGRYRGQSYRGGRRRSLSRDRRSPYRTRDRNLGFRRRDSWSRSPSYSRRGRRNSYRSPIHSRFRRRDSGYGRRDSRSRSSSYSRPRGSDVGNRRQDVRGRKRYRSASTSPYRKSAQSPNQRRRSSRREARGHVAHTRSQRSRSPVVKARNDRTQSPLRGRPEQKPGTELESSRGPSDKAENGDASAERTSHRKGGVGDTQAAETPQQSGRRDVGDLREVIQNKRRRSDRSETTRKPAAEGRDYNGNGRQRVDNASRPSPRTGQIGNLDDPSLHSGLLGKRAQVANTREQLLDQLEKVQKAKELRSKALGTMGTKSSTEDDIAGKSPA